MRQVFLGGIIFSCERDGIDEGKSDTQSVLDGRQDLEGGRGQIVLVSSAQRQLVYKNTLLKILCQMH